MSERLDYHSIASDLVQMAIADQDMRTKAMEDGSWDAAVDHENTAKLKQILAKHKSWISISEFGPEASEAAWILAQHADAEPAFQAKCLSMMKAIPDGDVSRSNIAYLEDRVRVNTGQLQLYGTQFMGTGSSLVERPIEDIDNLEARRASMGLVAFEENKQRIIEMDKKSKQFDN